MELTEENRSTRGKSCPSATLSTINPTWTHPGSNLDLHVEGLATNRLSHGTALRFDLMCLLTLREHQAEFGHRVFKSVIIKLFCYFFYPQSTFTCCG
jgi:hypothetical protein